MTNRQDDTAPTDRPAENTAKGDYEVGYGKPPVAHRFKPGNKANPKGRKKGSRNRKVVIREVLLEPVTVHVGGETIQMSALEAVLKKMLSKALTGEHKPALALIGLAQREGLLTAEQEQVVEDFSENDLAILEDV